ncbi:MAG: hypothetical protein QXN45_06065 [Candidatus Thermoplasmatota archaeon]
MLCPPASEFLSHLELSFLDQTLKQIKKMQKILNLIRGTSSYETIRYFINDLLPEKIEEIFYAVVKEMGRKINRRCNC